MDARDFVRQPTDSTGLEPALKLNPKHETLNSKHYQSTNIQKR